MVSDIEALPIPPQPEQSAVVRIAFAPSPSLDDALHRFLLPKFRERSIPLYSELSLRVPFEWSDSNGPRYNRADAQQLANHELRLRDIGGQPLRIGAMDAMASQRGDLRLRFELSLTPPQRRQLGGVVIGNLINDPGKQVWVYAPIWHGVAVSETAAQQEASRINHLIESPGRQSRAMGSVATKFFVNRPRLIERTGNLRGVS